ncbi:sigma-54-dependent Fis family transcriptional regulator [Pseudomonas cichorii]|nr:sigma-54-dependent Fis family transcriptional regulator [Pseudomonas cichorii]
MSNSKMNTDLTVLIVEDDPHVLLGCQQALALEDITCEGVSSAEEALARIGDNFAGIVISDIRLPGIDGLELLTRLKARDSSLPVVLITGHGDISMAVNAMRDGAYDFMEKPFSPERLVDVARRALEQRGLAREVWALRKQLAERNSLEGKIIGRSPAMQNLRALIANIADTSANVLIEGETGTGKELVARCLHDFSRRTRNQFVALNCGGLAESLFESEIFGHEANAFTGAGKRRIGKIEHAHNGTLFLDEVESMPINLQIKLLRVLQERTLERLGSNQNVEVDCRVIAATKSDLNELSKANQFRSDLYYRLNVVTLELPPLRERREDILQLFEHFLQLSSLRFDREPPQLDRQTASTLMSHDWPGNVRELRNVAERYALGLPVFKKSDQAESQSLGFAEAVEAFERNLLREALQRSGGNLSQASQELSMAKTTLFDKVKKYGLQA